MTAIAIAVPAEDILRFVFFYHPKDPRESTEQPWRDMREELHMGLNLTGLGLRTISSPCARAFTTDRTCVRFGSMTTLPHCLREPLSAVIEVSVSMYEQ